MTEIPYVSDKANAVARWMEKRLQEAAPSAGILFVSVRAVPVKGGKATAFDIRLGIVRSLEERTGMILIEHLFREEIKAGIAINAAVYRGVRGAARDESDATPHPDPS